jgi:hypothetical protein
LFGALISGAIADSFGLQAAMLTGSVVFFMATLIWWSLPETLGANGHHNAKSDARGKG